jgi:hypothetical protein
MLRKTRNGGQEPVATESDRIRREPMPTAHAILWRPLPDSYHLLASMMVPSQAAHLFITQRAFLQVDRHLRSAPDLELGGFLAGHRYICPTTGTPYSIINTVISFADVTGEPLGSRVTNAAHDAVQRPLEAHRLSLIGWYRNGAALGLQLLPDDVDTHIAFFDRPWQTTMLVVPGAAKSKGAFFTYDRRVGRSYCIPFYELFDPMAAESNRLDRTCVPWTTYVPSVAVQPLPEADREVVETTLMPRRHEPPPEPREPIDEWWDAIKDPWVRLKDVAATAKRHEGESLPLIFEPSAQASSIVPVPLEQLPKAAPPPARPTPPPAETASGSQPIATVSQKAEWPKSEKAPSRPAPPFVGPPRSASAEARAPTSPIRPPPAAPAPKPRAIPAARAAAMHRAATAPPVVLPPDFNNETKRWRLVRRIGFAIAAASLLGVIALTTVRSRLGRVAQAATNEAIVRVAPVSAPEALDNGTASLSLSSAIDSLAVALAYYRDLADKHRNGVVGCRALDRAYSAVARARIRVDSMRRDIKGSLTDADAVRASMLGAEFTHVSQIYLRSGCR